MKKIILLTIISTVIVFTSCKKKSDEPAPNNSTPPATIKRENILIQNGTTLQLNTKLYKVMGYQIVGYATSGSYQSILVHSVTAAAFKTTTNVDFSNTAVLQLSYTNNSGVYYAYKGSGKVIVSDTSTYIIFTDATFKKNGGTEEVTYSGQLSINANTPELAISDPTAVTTGSVYWSDANRTLSVSGNTNPNGYNLTGNYSLVTLSATFFPERPKVSKTIDLASATPGLSLVYSSGTTSYYAQSGTATVTVDGTAVSISFTNAVFKDRNSTSTQTVKSGSLATSK